MFPLDGLVRALDLEPAGPGRYVGRNIGDGGPVVHGGQLLAQAVVAAARSDEGKRVKTLHIVFARGASPEAPMDLTVEETHTGRTFSSRTVTMAQGERLCARAMVLLDAPEPDLIRHADAAPRADVPPADTPVDDRLGAWQVRVSDDVDIDDPEAVGPADLDVWTRFEGAPEDPVTDQALVALATDGFLIATAMRPHAGVGQAQAHVTLSTGVISHTLTFHEPARASEWLLLAHHSPYAGGGRSYGRADVFRADGALVASFVQDAMIRPRRPAAGAL